MEDEEELLTLGMSSVGKDEVVEEVEEVDTEVEDEVEEVATEVEEERL